jgi:hypothetical protein
VEGQGLGFGRHARRRQGEEAELRLALAVLAFLALPAQANEALWTLLKGGGQLATIVALTGISPGTGEMVVVTPRGNGKFVVAGRLEVR